jgi:diacylglycerol kinase family enzyme
MSPASEPAPPDIVCLLNNSAGVSRTQTPADKLADLFAQRGASALVQVAASGGDLADLARRAVALKPRIIAAGGGDGTISCVASAIGDCDIILGVLPMGTLNHFARDLGIPLALEEAVDAIVHGEAARVDVGEVNGNLFLNNSSLGLYPRLVREREKLQGGGAGKTMAFIRAIRSVLSRYAHIDVRLQASGEGSRRRPTPFVFIGNNQYRSEGWNIGTRERLDAGKLWIYMAPYKGPLGLMLLALRALLGWGDDAQVDSFETGECWIETRRPRVDVARDGEVTRMQSPLRYRIRPGALRVMKPAARPPGA